MAAGSACTVCAIAAQRSSISHSTQVLIRTSNARRMTRPSDVCHTAGLTFARRTVRRATRPQGTYPIASVGCGEATGLVVAHERTTEDAACADDDRAQYERPLNAFDRYEFDMPGAASEPRSATDTSPAARTTAWLRPEAVPAHASGTPATAACVSADTARLSPKPKRLVPAIK